MSKVTCDHCHLEFDDSVMIVDEEHYFCCKGCQGIYHLLADEGLERFYDKMGDTTLEPPTEQFNDAKNFDAPAFYERFVSVNEEGFQEVSLIIEGIHCSACVWLNEKALHKLEGVVEAHINYTNNKARIVWSDEVIKLSGIIEMIRAIGYNAFPYDPSIQEVQANKERKDYYLRMAVATFASMNIMWIAVAQYAGYFTGITQEVKTILNIAEWVLATPVLFYSGWIFFRGAYYGLKTKTVNMDILVATGASLTYIYSIYITLLEQGEAYFDSVSMIITFVLLGKFLEVLSKKSAADALDVMSKHIPEEVNVLRDESIQTIGVKDVVIGDIIVLSAGEKAAIDGEVTEGEGGFDESSLTGESEPVYKSLGSKIISGTTSIDATIRYKSTKDFENSTLANLVKLLEKSMAKKPKIEQLANTLSEYFSSTILLLSLVTFVVWWFWPHSFETAFMVGISVIIIACPCALALATPVATLVGIGIGSSRGILFKEAAQLETMAKVDLLVVDKTGTLTEGKPEVIEADFQEATRDLIFSLTKYSQHPVAQGVTRYLENEECHLIAFEKLKQVPARGIEALYDGKVIVGGNAALMHEYGVVVDSSSTGSNFFVALDGELIATLILRDQPKAVAKEMVGAIENLGVTVIMLTGDHEGVARSIAKEVGINEVHHSLTPKEKESFIAQQQALGRHVVMAGDGVNDILALARADIGIAMGNGSDIAIDMSDVVLLNDSLESLYEAFKISRTTYKLIKQNLALSLVYNAITIPLAMGGYIIPLIAAISMSFSSLLVVGNSMRIKLSWKR